MPGARQWMGRLMLRVPDSLRSVRNLPGVGGVVHRLSHWALPDSEKVWAQIESGPAKGLWMELNPRTGQNCLRGDTEPAVQERLVSLLRAGMTFYDLGANIGYYSLLAARNVGPDGRVFSFEPNPEVAARLRRNLARNRFENATVIEAGVWSSSGLVTFVPSNADSPDQATGRFAAGDNIAGTPARCVALDDFVGAAPAPEGIKCDVEGAEVEVLRGAERMLRSRRPWIMAEMHSPENDQAWREFLGRLDYTFETVDGNHILARP